MPHKRKDSPFWWVSYTDAVGRRVRASSGTEDRREAAALESKLRYESHRQQTWGVEPTRTFGDLMLTYLRETKGKKSHERDKYSLKRLTPHFKGMVLNTLSPQDISDYKRKRYADGVKDGTIIKELRLFSAAINHARKEWGWDIPNVVLGRTPKKPPSKLRWLNQKEYHALVKAAGESWKAPYIKEFIVIAVNTGMRKGEILGLEWNRVDLGKRMVYLQPDDAKGGAFQTIPLNDAAVEGLRGRWGKHKRLVFGGIKSVKKALAGAVERAELKDVTAHTLRHTFAAWLAQAGVPIRTIAELLRHQDIRTSMIYSHLAPDNARAGVAILDAIQRDQNVTDNGESGPNSGRLGQDVTQKAS